jgi:hypothetical protein
MADHCKLWLEYSDDRRVLRDFLFDACKCTRFWVAPNATRSGRPDDQERDHYGIYSDYHLIDIRPKMESPEYKNDLNVFFTLNQPERWVEWMRDIAAASIGWMARSSGDALLEWDGLPLIARKGPGPVLVNDFSQNVLPPRFEYAQSPEYQSFIDEALLREGLVHEMAPVKPI